MGFPGRCVGRFQVTLRLKRALTAITHDREDAMWIGTDGAGLFRIKDGETSHFNKERGLLSDAIRTLFLDSRGALWIGTADGGLGHWFQGQLNTITAREGLPDNTILQILEDDHGHLWLGTKRGIARVRKAELESLSAGKITSVYPQVYGRAEGMLSEECTGGFHPAGLKAKSGLLWISTMKGVVVANPKPQRAPMPEPSVVLEQVLVDGIEAADRGSCGNEQSVVPGQPIPVPLKSRLRPESIGSNSIIRA